MAGSAFSVGVESFDAFADSLIAAGATLETELTLKLHSLGQQVGEKAKALISDYSESIPPSIQVLTGNNQVKVEADGVIAGLLEYGNSGSTDAAFFSHPVFGNASVTVEQPTHPFLGVAIDEDEVEAAATEALDIALERAVH